LTFRKRAAKGFSMPMLDLPAFAAALPPRGAILGVDPGEKRIGVAVSDTTRLIASSLATITRTKFAADAEALFKFYDARQCAGLVIGGNDPVDDGVEKPNFELGHLTTAVDRRRGQRRGPARVRRGP
jgi:hypothetical protein